MVASSLLGKSLVAPSYKLWDSWPVEPIVPARRPGRALAIVGEVATATDVLGSWRATVTAPPLIADVVTGLDGDVGPLGEHLDG